MLQQKILIVQIIHKLKYFIMVVLLVLFDYDQAALFIYAVF